MGCSSSREEQWDDRRPPRSTSDTAFDYASPRAARSGLRPSPNKYGDAFQSVAAGKRTTVAIPPKVQIIDPTTYERYPPEREFELDMLEDYNSYKTVQKQKELIQAGYKTSCQSLGPQQRWTSKEHERMRNICEGPVDSAGRRRRASPMLYEANREGAYRSGFNHKYPRAYDSYKGRLDHEHHAYMQGQFAPRQAEHHVIERDNALVQEITPGRRRR